MPSLFVIRGRDQGKFFSLDPAGTRIGRDPSNPIQLFDDEASRYHAELSSGSGTGSGSESGGRFEIVDLNSSNGTLLNGEKISRHALRSGDRIQIGQTLMIFTGSGTPESMRAAHSVDIVTQANSPDHSRIVSSWSPPHAPATAATDSPSTEHGPRHSRELDRRSLDVMYQTAIAVGRTMQIPELLERVLNLVFDWVEADRGCVMLRDNDTGQLRPAARCDREKTSAGGKPDTSGERMLISRTILDFVMDRREGVRTTDAKEDIRWDAAQSIVQLGIREALCVPLMGRYECVGAIYVDTFTKPKHLVLNQPSSRFTDEHLRLMTAIGHQAALAIEDTFYYSSLVQNERLAAIGQTIAILSHHIKNILQGMKGGGYLIGAGLDREDPAAIRRGLNIVEKNQERISNLVLDMLSYSKEREPERVTANLNDTIADVIELMLVRAEEQHCKLVFQPDGSVPEGYFDPEAMHRAILNLVTNAIDAVADCEQAEVTVSCGYSDAGWWIEVRDNGPGVDPEDREKIFSLFESRKGARGTGLGLPVSQKIVAEHGGSITLCEQSSSGCTFRIMLPGPATTEERIEGRETMI